MTSIFSLIKRGSSQPAQDPLAVKHARIKALKEEALTLARNDANHEFRKPTLTDYFIACETLGEQRAAQLQAEGIVWDRKVYTDLSGLMVQGYLIRQEDLNPPVEIRQRAAERAESIAAHQQRDLTVLDFLRAMKHELDIALPVKKSS